MPYPGDYYEVEVLEPHVDWGTYRNPTNRAPIEGESYVKIASDVARNVDIKRGDRFKGYFGVAIGPGIEIKAAGNGPKRGDVQYAKQFEGDGEGACKTFTPLYRDFDINVGDRIRVEFISPFEVLFTKA